MDASIQEKRRPSAEQVLVHLIQMLQSSIKDGYREVEDDTSPEAPPRKYILRQFEHLHITDYFQLPERDGDVFMKYFGNSLGIWLIDSKGHISISEKDQKEIIATMPKKTPEVTKSFSTIASIDFSYDPNLGEERRAWHMGRGRGYQTLYSGVHVTEGGALAAEKADREWIGG